MKSPALLVLLMGCASSAVAQSVSLSEMLGSPNCGSGEFRGIGIGKSDGEALNIARSDLAKQINSSLKVSEKYRQSQQVLNGKENLSSEYKSDLVVEANLLNAHDARVLRVERRQGETGTVVCMSRSDAAKPFLERQRLAADSLEMVSSAMLSAKHPKLKNEAWHKTQMLWDNLMKTQSLLEGLGAAKTDYPVKADEAYAGAKSDYQAYCQSMKLHWEDTDSQCSKAIFTELSKKVKMEKSKCSAGLNLVFSCSEECKSTSMGLKCFFEPSLAIESCGGESYSRLSAKEPPSSSDRNSENAAKEKLVKSLPQSAFLEDWKTELKKWEPQCVK